MNALIRRASATTAAVAAAALLTACGGTTTNTDQSTMPGMGAASSSASPGASAHNAADVAFASGMVPHHQQAVTMADAAATRAASAQLKSLAASIKAAQAPEIATMSGWLSTWGQPVDTSTTGHSMSGMGSGQSASGMSGMSGMMSDDDMKTLESSTGASFDRMWLTMMIKHHEGAVEMSRTELTSGQYPAAKQLAQQIITSQTAEIATMKAMSG